MNYFLTFSRKTYLRSQIFPCACACPCHSLKPDYSIWWNYHIYNKTFSALTRAIVRQITADEAQRARMQPVNVRQVWQAAEIETTDGWVTERRREPTHHGSEFADEFGVIQDLFGPPSKEAGFGPWLGSMHECNLDEWGSLAFGLINNNINSNYCDRLINPFKRKKGCAA